MRKYLSQIIAFTNYAIFSISWFLVSLLTKEIREELMLDNQQAVFITNAIFLAKIFGALLAWGLFYKFGLKIGYFIGALLIGISGVLMQYVGDVDFIKPFYFIVFLRFLGGLGGAVAIVALIPIAQKHFANEPKKLNIIRTCNVNSNMVGSIIAFAFSTSILAYFNGEWRDALVFFGWVNIALVVLWLFVDSKDEKKESKNTTSSKILKTTLKQPILWAMVLFYMGPLFFLDTTAFHVLLYIKDELVLNGTFTEQQAIKITSIFPTTISVILLFSPFIGVVLNNKGVSIQKILSLSAPCLIPVVCLYFLKSEYMFYLAAVCGGILFGIIVAVVFMIPSYYLKNQPELLSYVVSIFWAFTYILLFTNNQLAAYIYDNFHTYNFIFLYMIVLLAVTPFALLLLKKQKIS